MAEVVHLTILDGDEDARRWTYARPLVRIGSDATQGPDLLIELSPLLDPVLATIRRGEQQVELEVEAGEVWLGGARLGAGDVSTLGTGDVLSFGTSMPGAARVRFELAERASTKPRAGGGRSAKASEGRGSSLLVPAIVVGVLLVGAGLVFALLLQQREHEATERRLREHADGAMEAELRAYRELAVLKAAAGDEGQEALSDQATADGLAERFSGTARATFQPDQAVPMPDGTMESLVSLVSRAQAPIERSRAINQAVVQRICSPKQDKDRLLLVQRELARYAIHEAYGFVPFAESMWCELSIDPMGARGMLQLSRSTARDALRRVDATQQDIPAYRHPTHGAWLHAESERYGGYSSMLASCPAVVMVRYRQHFYGGQTNPDHPLRLDPNDPRTDWKTSTTAAMAWLAKLDGGFAGEGFAGVERVMLALSAFHQGEAEVQGWIDRAQALYGVEEAGALTYAQVHGGAEQRHSEATDPEERRMIAEGMAFAPQVVASYLVFAPMLDSADCR